MVGRIVEYSRSIDGNPRITFEVDSFDEIQGLDGELRIDVKKNKGHRSLTANAYFHKLVGLIADAMTPPISKARCKNMMLARYGQRETIDDCPVKLSSETEPDKMMELEYIHCQPIGIGIAGGKQFYHYAVIRGSHTYDTKEMSILIDGTVMEAKQLEIQTLSPNEIERLKNLWQSNQS